MKPFSSIIALCVTERRNRKYNAKHKHVNESVACYTKKKKKK